ncbi:hypothetical protein Leryth_021462 [Lithospermum erythrorhizon]|nr:hypothetical protein Leryth_021462 [Lithospermum erythrorhizon]
MVGDKVDKFNINDNMDILIEIMKRLDDRSLGVASCVCRLWCSITMNDSLWEHLCFRHHYPSISASPPPQLPLALKPLVHALGGYRRLYMLCVRPLLLRRRRSRLMYHHHDNGVWWTRQELELSLSLFCVDYYERMLIGNGGGGAKVGTGNGDRKVAAPSSLMFLYSMV